MLEGQFGAGTLTGSGGVDVFKYFPEGNLGEGDLITDFNARAEPNQNRMQFYTGDWGDGTTLHRVNGTKATNAVNTFIFSAATHFLSYDADGTGSDAAVDVVVPTGVTALIAANFDLN
ncbi:MAG: hypothetical protein H7245_22860 [Candidatus Saccharibacteria bacterium]|nr:hypothetical protein [Pseudorhodobacter sp.]